MTQVFNPNPELVVPTGIPTIEAQAENEKKKKKKYRSLNEMVFNVIQSFASIFVLFTY